MVMVVGMLLIKVMIRCIGQSPIVIRHCGVGSRAIRRGVNHVLEGGGGGVGTGEEQLRST